MTCRNTVLGGKNTSIYSEAKGVRFENTWAAILGVRHVQLTLVGVWIQIAALNKMWSHSCFSSGAPCVRPSKYFAKESSCSSTSLVMCARDDYQKQRKDNVQSTCRVVQLWQSTLRFFLRGRAQWWIWQECRNLKTLKDGKNHWQGFEEMNNNVLQFYLCSLSSRIT